MGFRGLFIGVDKYRSPDIAQLGCAERDAKALYALFADNLGDGGKLLINENATRQAVEEGFKSLFSAAADDIVIISFAGHGSETRELVPHDADLENLPTSGIPLETLKTWFEQIPSKKLVLILDCCFSGGIGARVVSPVTKPRALSSADVLLKQLSGDGRLIITASQANEEASENSKYGHGLLTYFLVQALQGAEEVREAGKVSIYRLLEYVGNQVSQWSARTQIQHPCLRGQIDGVLTWPIFKKGKVFESLFPGSVYVNVSADIRGLEKIGFPARLVDVWAQVIPKLNDLQLAAINEFKLFEGGHLVVSAPTSSGKTMIGEMAAVRNALQGKRSFFLFPLRALVNDKHAYFNRLYGAFGLKTIRATGEIADDIPALMKGKYDICLVTYEKFAALVLNSPHILNQVGTIIVDEVQMIVDKHRGVNLEFLLTLLKMQRRHEIEPQMVLLSAVIGDTNGLERWLDARLLKRAERPVPLKEGLLCQDGQFRHLDLADNKERMVACIRPEYRKGSSQDWIIPLVRKLVRENKKVIVFRSTRGEARGAANYLKEELGLPEAKETIDALPTGDQSMASEALRNALSGGVAFHSAELDRDERLIVEENFRKKDGSLKVICATTTLAMGVNTPTEAVVVAGLDHPGPEPYAVAEYKNIVGRAGRLGHASEGESYIIAINQSEEHQYWNRYVLGQPENLESRFISKNSDPRSLVVRVLAAQSSMNKKHGLTADEIIDFLQNSFAAFQQIRISHTWTWDRNQLLQAITDLEKHKLIISNNANYSLTPLGKFAGEAGVEIESIVRLVQLFSRINPRGVNDATLIIAAQLTVELDNVLFPINRKSTQKEPQTWAQELRGQGVDESVIGALSNHAQDQIQPTLRAKKAVVCLLSMTDTPMAEIERVLTQFGGAFNGASGDIRNVRSRTCDLLPTVIDVAEHLHPGLDLQDNRFKLLLCLEIGIPEESLDLAKYTKSNLARRDYLELLQSGMSKIEKIQKCTDAILLKHLRGDSGKLAHIREAIKTHETTPAQSSKPILKPKISN